MAKFFDIVIKKCPHCNSNEFIMYEIVNIIESKNGIKKEHNRNIYECIKCGKKINIIDMK